MPRGRRRPRSWARKALLFRRAAVGCYAAALPLALLAFRWSRPAWLATVALLLAGSWCERGALLAFWTVERRREGDDIPGG